MVHLAVKVVINAVALWAAAQFIPGIRAGGVGSLLLMAVVFGVVNALIRPVLKFLSCPVILLTLGLFTLVLNALMLWLSAWLGASLGIDFSVAGFWPAFWGALVVSVVSTVLSFLLPGGR